MAITGIDPAREHAATDFDDRVADGRPLARDGGSYEVLLGRGLATRLSAAPGDTLVILSQGADGSLANDLYTISGIVESGDRMGDQSALYMHIADAQELLVLGDRVHQITIVADSPKKLFGLADGIAAAIGRDEVVVEPWQVFAKPFYDAMVADQQGNWISLFIIMMVVSVGVLNTVLMSVLERTREYGLLRAMGTHPRQVFSLVVVEVMVMAVFSIILGAVVALIANYLLSIYGISLPEEFSFAGFEFKEMRAEINLRSFLIPLWVVLLSAFLVSLFPAARAACTAPAAAMRSV